MRGETTISYLLKSFTMRRVLRLLPGYFLALLLYIIILSPDVLKNFLWYLSNCSNIHFARLGYWPGGADQFWTLAVDQQFYAFWPFLILFLPRKFLPISLILLAGLSPLSRHLSYFDLNLFSGPMKDKLPWFLTDHLCMGALLAVLHEQKKFLPRRALWILLLISLLLYLPLRYKLFGLEQYPFLYLWQQTILAVFSTSLVALAAGGIKSLGAFLLEHPVIQYIGKRSYGYYLYHNLAVLLLGKIAFFLFPPEGTTDYFFILRLILSSFILVAMAHYSWKYVEEPFMRRKDEFYRYSPNTK